MTIGQSFFLHIVGHSSRSEINLSRASLDKSS